MNTHCRLLDDVQEGLLNDDIMKSREGLFFLANQSSNFLRDRKKAYLRKIVQTHINFREKLSFSSHITKRAFLQKFYKVQWIDGAVSRTLGICFAFVFFQSNEKFEYKHLASIIKRLFPGIRIEEDVTYFCQFPQEKILFVYAEIEKIRGKHLSLQETLKLKKVLFNNLGETIETIYSDLFIPTNEEEIYKHIATLSHDVSSLSSLPHIMISFVKQNHDVLFFNVVLVRLIQLGVKPFEKIAQHLPLKVRIYVNKTALSTDSQIKEICVFSVEIPTVNFQRKNFSIDYLKIRRYLSLVLEEHIGEFRDYNGGLLIKQYEQLDHIIKKLSNRLDNFSLLEELFFSFVPSNAQTLINAEVAFEIHQLFHKIKEIEYQSLYKMEFVQSKGALVVFIKTNQEKVESLLYSVVLDENFLAAYAKKVVDNQIYFCFLEINPSDLTLLVKLKKALNDLDVNFSKIPQDTLRIPLQESLPPTLHPHFLTDTNSFTMGKALYEGLTRISLEGVPELAIARKIEISPNGKQYKITLKKTRWSNGEPLVADHFINAWKKAIEFNSKCLRPHFFYAIKNAEKISKGLMSMENIGIKKESDSKLIVNLEYPAPYFNELIAIPTLSPLYNSTDDEPIIFNGPYKLSFQEKNKKITFLKNNFYWDSNTVKLTKINLTLEKDVSKIIKSFYKEKFDWIGSPFTNLLEESSKYNFSFQLENVLAPFLLHCNTRNPKLSSIKIRKALSLAIDRTKIGSEVLPNQVPSYSIVPETLSQLILFEKDYEKNIELAKYFFSEGLKEIKQTSKNFFLILSYSTSTYLQKSLVFFLKKTWENTFKIKILLKQLEWNVHWNNLFNGEYELGGACRFPIYKDIYCFLEPFLSVRNNFSGWKNNNFHELMDLAKNEILLEKRREYLKSAEEILQDNMPVIPIYNRVHLYLKNSRLKNLIPPKLSYTDFKWAYFE